MFGAWRRQVASPVLDRWAVMWGAAACFFLYMAFLGRHFFLRSLSVELPVAAMFLLTLHAKMVLHPQITDLRRQIAAPKYAGTVRLMKLQYCFDRLHRRSVELRGAMMALGCSSLALMLR